MSKQRDWTKANAKPARVLSWKEQRLERAADNWIEGGSLYRKPAKAPAKRLPDPANITGAASIPDVPDDAPPPWD